MFRSSIFAACVVAAVSSGCSSDVVSTQPPEAVRADAGADSGTNTGTTASEDGGTSSPKEDAGTSAGDAGSATEPDAGEPEPVIRFAAVGDTGKGNADQQAVADAIVAKCAASGCDFVLFLGDNIYPSGVTSVDDPQWQTKFEQPYANVNVPIYVVLGNHDYGGDGTGNEFSKGQHEVDYTQKSTKWKLPAKYYRMTQQHVEFFALDTNMQMYGLDSQQEADVADWLAQSTAVWKIVLGHHPYKSNGPHGNAGSYDGVSWIPIANGAGVKSFAEDIWCGKADFYLSGHDHSRQYLQDTCSGTELLVSGTGASATSLDGNNPVHFQTLALGLVWIEIRGRTLTAEFIGNDGQVEYTRTVTK